jgi:hypothetical protein
VSTQLAARIPRCSIHPFAHPSRRSSFLFSRGIPIFLSLTRISASLTKCTKAGLIFCSSLRIAFIMRSRAFASIAALGQIRRISQVQIFFSPNFPPVSSAISLLVCFLFGFGAMKIGQDSQSVALPATRDLRRLSSLPLCRRRPDGALRRVARPSRPLNCYVDQRS